MSHSRRRRRSSQCQRNQPWWNEWEEDEEPEAPIVSAESDQQVNICSFAVRCDQRWPITQWHRIYTSSDNVPYVQFESVGDFIPKPRCSKFAVGLQMSRNEKGVLEARSDSEPNGWGWRVL